MADQSTNTTTADNLLAIYLEKRALTTLQNDVVMDKLISPENRYTIPAGMGVQTTWNSWPRLAGASSTLAEASSNSAVNLSARKVNVSIASYGRAVKYTDLLKKTGILDVEEGALEAITNSMATTKDNVLQYAILGGGIERVGQDASTANSNKLLSALMSSISSSFCEAFGENGNSAVQWGFKAVIAGTATRCSAVKRSSAGPTSSCVMGPYAMNQCVRVLNGKNTPKFADGFYRGAVHTDAFSDMLLNPQFKSWYQGFGGGVTKLEKHEIPPCAGVRLFASTNMPKVAGDSRPLYLSVIAGKGALGSTSLAGGSMDVIITKPSGSSTNDPFHLNSYVAFKLRCQGACLNPSAAVVLIHSQPKSV